MQVKKILLFTLFWFILSMIQSIFSEIIDDEAYYWVYSQFLDWGYFDHPPMIAWLIKIGSSLFPMELGVRLLPSLLGAATIFLVFFMLKDEVRDFRLLMLVSLSIPILHSHVAGFIATPDLPLVFSATLFFFLYRRYLANETPAIILLLSLSIALMMYSKYHAFLIIGFTVLSNLRILFQRSFWLIALISSILYLPHILWQVRHDFVSFGYHLIDRNNPFEVKYLFEYIGNQLLMIGPLSGVLLLYLGITRKPTGKFETALKFNLIGFILFFLVSSLRGHVEPHWTAAAIVPLLLISVPVIEQNLRLKKWISILSLITIPFIILIRVFLIDDFSLLPDKLTFRFHHKEEMFKQIQKEAAGRPVVFSNSYQAASLYWFFNREPAFSQNNKNYRKNQFDLMDLESELQGKEVLYFPPLRIPGSETLKTVSGNLDMFDTEYFCFFNRVEIKLPQIRWEFQAEEEVHIDLTLGNPTESTICFCDSCTHKPRLIYTYYSREGIHKAFKVKPEIRLPDLAPGENLLFPVRITAPEIPGKYQLMFSFGSEYLPAGINGRSVTMSVYSTSTKSSK